MKMVGDPSDREILPHDTGELGCAGNSETGYAYATFDDNWGDGNERFPIAQKQLKEMRTGEVMDDLETPLLPESGSKHGAGA